MEKAGGRIWPVFKNDTEWGSSVEKVHRMLSPAWIQSSFGKKARATFPRSALCAPAAAFHSVAETVPAVTPAIIATTANGATRFDLTLNRSFIVIPP
jgi:hypothetical protein